MNRINKHNYEAYFLDYHEGNLDAEGKQEIMSFLKDHPEFYDEFQDFESLVLPIPDITFPDKSELFKTDVSIPEANEWEFRCIAFIEGDLSDEELIDFDAERHSDPNKAKILDLYLATKSVPDENIQFREKSSLKKKVVLFPKWIYGAVSAAAIIVLGWIIISPFSQDADNKPIANDLEREVIFFNKLAHPERYEKLASIQIDPASIKRHTSAYLNESIESREMLSIEDEYLIRDKQIIASLTPMAISRVEASIYSIPTASSSFAYRFIPGAEDGEYQTLVAFTGDQIRMQLLGQDPELVKNSKFSFWELADASLEKVSNVFGTGADIEREYSDEGDLVAVSFESALVGFNTPVKRRSAVQID